MKNVGIRDVRLSISMALLMQFKVCVFNKVILIHYWRNILDCRCEFLFFVNYFRDLCPLNAFTFPLDRRST